jgi:hypothetical protein
MFLAMDLDRYFSPLPQGDTPASKNNRSSRKRRAPMNNMPLEKMLLRTISASGK